MNRRNAFKTALSGALAVATASTAASAAPATASGNPMIVMVHGSWHWGGCFQKVADLLAGTGYPVATPDLTSHGYSPAAYDSFTTIADYARPVEDILKASPHPVVLVGHSIGGVSATYLAEKYPEKIAKLIYLTSFMVPNGRKALDYILLNAKIPAAKELFQVVSQVNGGRGLKLDIANRAALKAALYGDCSEHDIDVVAKNALIVTSTIPDQTVSNITPARYGRVPRIYIECLQDKAIPLETQRRMVNDVPGARVMSLPTSHSSFLSQPRELANLIVAAIAS